MSAKKENIELPKVEESAVVYESSKLKFEGVHSPLLILRKNLKKAILQSNLKKKCSIV